MKGIKRKLLLSPLIIIILIIIAGIGLAGAAIYVGAGTGGETNTESVNLQKGLVGQWKMDGNANDSTSYQNDGTVTGAALTTDRKGQVNKAYSFNGTSAYIDLGLGKIGNSIQGSSATTVSMWINYSALAGTAGQYDNVILSGKVNGASSNVWLNLRGDVGSAGKLLVGGRSTTADTFQEKTSTSVLSQSGWHHVVGILNFTNDQINIAIDGVLETATSVTFASNTYTQGTPTANDQVGNDATTRYFTGSIDDVRVYNRALSATEITALYQEYNPGIQVSDLQKGLVGQWKMDGDANDSTPYQHNGTVTSATLTTDRKGQSNKAYSFNGTSSRIQITTPSGINGGTTLAISFWVKPDSTFLSDFRDIFSFGASKFRFENSTSTQDDFSIYNAGIDSATITCSNCWTVDSWNHTVFVSDGTNWRLYVNNVSKANGTVDSTLTGSGTITLGSRDGSTAFWKGVIDDVRVYNRALSATEVTALYQEYNPGIQVSDLQKGLVGQWKMDGNANDSTSYTNDGTVTGATLITDRKGQANKAYLFNGVADYISIGNNSSIKPQFPVTMAAWVYKSVDDVAQIIVGNDNGIVASNYGGLNMRFNSSNKLLAAMGDGSGAGAADRRYYTGASDILLGEWHHLSIVWRAYNDISMYIDGVAEVVNYDSGTATTLGYTSVSGAIGAQGNGSSLLLSGQIDDVRIYNRVLSSSEVLELYQSY